MRGTIQAKERRSRRTIAAGGLACALGVWTAPADAQEWSGDARNTATAQALFDEARAEMQEGGFATACPKLEEVIRLEPKGVGAKVKLAECYELADRLASAHAMYSVAEAAARTAGQDDRAAWARDKAAELKPILSTLTIEVDPRAAALAGLDVRRSGAQVGAAQWGTAIAVDGGVMEIVVSAPGYVTRRAAIEVAARNDAKAFRVEPLEPAAAAPAPKEGPPEPEAPAPRAPAPPVDAPPRAGRVPTWAWITGGVGIASGLAGIAFRIDGAVVEADQADACGPARDRCPASYDVEGTNQRKLVDFGLFVGLGSAGAAALGAAAIGAAVGLAGADPSTRAAIVVEPVASGITVALRGALP